MPQKKKKKQDDKVTYGWQTDVGIEEKIHTGSQMQQISTANAKADIIKQGRKYGNLQFVFSQMKYVNQEKRDIRGKQK